MPDLISVVGTLTPPKLPSSSSFFGDGSATLQARLRVGEPFPGQPGYVWTVEGEKGELRLEAAAGPAMIAVGGGNNNEGPMAVKLWLHDFATNEVTEVPWHWQDWQSTLESVGSRNIGAVYEAYAEGREADYATFADAQARHEQLDGWLDGFSG